MRYTIVGLLVFLLITGSIYARRRLQAPTQAPEPRIHFCILLSSPLTVDPKDFEQRFDTNLRARLNYSNMQPTTQEGVANAKENESIR